MRNALWTIETTAQGLVNVFWRSLKPRFNSSHPFINVTRNEERALQDQDHQGPEVWCNPDEAVPPQEAYDYILTHGNPGDIIIHSGRVQFLNGAVGQTPS